jgi:hypothetical protein
MHAQAVFEEMKDGDDLVGHGGTSRDDFESLPEEYARTIAATSTARKIVQYPAE